MSIPKSLVVPNAIIATTEFSVDSLPVCYGTLSYTAAAASAQLLLSVIITLFFFVAHISYVYNVIMCYYVSAIIIN